MGWEDSPEHGRLTLMVAGGMLAVLVAAGLLAVFFLHRASRKAAASPTAGATPQAAGAGGAPRQRGLNRLQAGVRRRRAAAAAAAAEAAEEQGADADEEEEAEGEGGRGAGRDRAREVRRAAREAERNARDARQSKKDAYEERRRRREEEREEREAAVEAEAAAAAAARRAAEDAEAAQWMGLISVDDAGTSAVAGPEEQQGLLQAFIDFIKEHKTVLLEDLASEFGLRIQEAISRVRELEAAGRLSGVMDDRGKFIYISPEEMAAVAAFIRRTGRVAITELAARSADFIDLQPRAGASAAGVEVLDFDLNLDAAPDAQPQPAAVAVH